MKALYKELLENSIAASLSAIEIYNKPDFKYRNEVFVILIINSWELLLKAKIVKDNSGKVNSIYIYYNNRIKKNRNKTPFTIDIFECIKQLKLSDTLTDNLTSLIEIRDSSIHFYNRQNLSYIIYSLAAASLKNYQKLCKDWFTRDLLEYNFYILPLGYNFNFKTFSLMELNKEPDTIKTLLENISQNQNKPLKDGFQFTCEIELKLTSAKKITEKTDLTVSIDNNSTTATVAVIKTQKLTDQYQLSWTELWNKLKTDFPNLRQTDYIKLLQKNKIKDNKKFSNYNFRTKKDEDNFNKTGKVKQGTNSIYNEECYLFLHNEINKKSL
ncbi:MAG: hypothetical protein RIQ33_1239 [Bacteroidota bacterium]|jgi:hypothetical protein